MLSCISGCHTINSVPEVTVPFTGLENRNDILSNPSHSHHLLPSLIQWIGETKFFNYIKKLLKILSKDSNEYYFLALTMIAIRSQVKEDLNCRTSEIVFGTQLRLPSKFFEQNQK